MATDATGTPTPKGIPKFNTSVDAPSGLGFNAAMDAIDGLLSWVKARKNSAGSVFERSRLNFIEGSNITITLADDAIDNEIDVTIASTSGGPGYGTALPGSPTDGQEFILVDSTTAPTYQWRFRYNNGATTNKWEFVGGSPKLIHVSTEESTTSMTYADLTTVQSFTVPVTGIYHAVASVGYVNSAANPGRPRHAIHYNGTAVSEAEGLTSNSTGPIASCQYTASILATQIIKQMFKIPGGTSTGFAFRTLAITPQRIGG